MLFSTGQTIYETVLSLDLDLNPISATTFDIEVFYNGVINTAVTVNMTLIDPQRGAFSSTWSGTSVGNYQVYYKNNVTSVIYITDVYQLTPNGLSPNIYIGL